jgi:HSP20 family protein
MTSIRWWDPMADLLDAHRTMDRVFDQFFGNGGSSAPEAEHGEVPTYYLPVDILETEGSYVLSAGVPGFSPDQVEVTFEDGVLSIFAKATPLQGEGNWVRRERPYGSFVRKLQLPQQVVADKISADFDNGLLTITVPKAAKPEPVKIGITGTQKQLTGNT